MKKSALILSIIFGFTLLLGVQGYVKLTTKIYETFIGKNIIEAPELAGEEGSNKETFILEQSEKSFDAALFESASISAKILHFENAINTYFSETLFKDEIININGGIQGAIGRDIIMDADKGSDVVRLENGYLARFQKENLVEYASRAEELIDLNAYLADKNIPFIYSHAPYKIEYVDLPIKNGAKNNYAYINDTLLRAGVKVIDIKGEMDKAGMDFFSSYYKTDHHWTAETGLWCAGMLAEKFSKDYGFEYDKSLLDPNNYTYEVLKDYFLGSQGKRVGTFYVGTDDFTVIHPKFETSLESDTLSTDGTWEYRSGTLEQTMYWNKHIETMDYFNLSPYTMYSNGDRPIQILRNNNAMNENKILVVKHSFANVTTPFLALAYREINVVDLRHKNRPDNLYEYIDEYNPDLVLFLW